MKVAAANTSHFERLLLSVRGSGADTIGEEQENPAEDRIRFRRLQGRQGCSESSQQQTLLARERCKPWLIEVGCQAIQEEQRR